MQPSALGEGFSGFRGSIKRRSDALPVVAVVALALIVGTAAGVSPKYALEGSIAVAFAAVMILDATVGLILFTVLSFMEVLTSSSATASLMKLGGLLLFGSWIAGAAVKRTWRLTGSLLSEAPVLVWATIALAAWSAMSVAWAGNSGAALSDTYRYVLNMLLIPIVFGTILTRRHVVWLAAAFVAGAVLSSLYGFVAPASSGTFQAGQLTGALGDANQEAAVLVGAIAFAFGLTGMRRLSPGARVLSATGILICLAGAVNTLSRSGLIALAAMMVCAVVVGGRWRKAAALLLIVSAVIGVGYYFTITSMAARTRVTSADTSGRSTIWAVGWRMVQAHPLTGVGSGNFQYAAIHYLQAPGVLTRADLIVDTPKVAHNIYLEVLADMGIPGLLLFLAIVIASAAAAWRAAHLFMRSGDRDLELMSRCVVLALVGFMTSNFFLSGQFDKQLWLVFAMGPLLLRMARRRTRQGEEDVVTGSTAIAVAKEAFPPELPKAPA
jgi:putative inorganic carbon (HCO3(-)) transporter